MVRKYKLRVGSRAQVMRGTAKMTAGGLGKRQLKYNKSGKIVSRRASNVARKANKLVKAGYITQKGVFGVTKIGGATTQTKSIDTLINELSRQHVSSRIEYFKENVWNLESIKQYDDPRTFFENLNVWVNDTKNIEGVNMVCDVLNGVFISGKYKLYEKEKGNKPLSLLNNTNFRKIKKEKIGLQFFISNILLGKILIGDKPIDNLNKRSKMHRKITLSPMMKQLQRQQAKSRQLQLQAGPHVRQRQQRQQVGPIRQAQLLTFEQVRSKVIDYLNPLNIVDIFEIESKKFKGKIFIAKFDRTFGKFNQGILVCNKDVQQNINRYCVRSGFSDEWEINRDICIMTKIPFMIVLLIATENNNHGIRAKMQAAYSIGYDPRFITINILTLKNKPDGTLKANRIPLLYLIPFDIHTKHYIIKNGWCFRTGVLSGEDLNDNRWILSKLIESIEQEEKKYNNQNKTNLISLGIEDAVYVNLTGRQNIVRYIKDIIDKIKNKTFEKDGIKQRFFKLSFDKEEASRGLTVLESEYNEWKIAVEKESLKAANKYIKNTGQLISYIPPLNTHAQAPDVAVAPVAAQDVAAAPVAAQDVAAAPAAAQDVAGPLLQSEAIILKSKGHTEIQNVKGNTIKELY